jgi:nucleoside-diphosphate-sugar epimerase
MRVLVTGGAGFIGSNLVRALVNIGWQVDVVDDLSSGQLESLSDLRIRSVPVFMSKKFEEEYENTREKNQVLFFEADFEHPNVLSRVERGYYDKVFHLAANSQELYSVDRPAQTTDVNVTRTISLLEAVNRAPNSPRFIFSSTSAVYGDALGPTVEYHECAPTTPHGLQKLMVEEFLKMSSKLYGTDAVSLRYFNVYGPNQPGDFQHSAVVSAWCNSVRDGRPLRLDGDGDQTRDFVYVDDVVRANILAATRIETFEGESFNIGTGRNVSNNYILTLFKNKFHNIELKKVPTRPYDVRDTQADYRFAEELLGWTPQVSLEEGLERTWEWWDLNTSTVTK